MSVVTLNLKKQQMAQGLCRVKVGFQRNIKNAVLWMLLVLFLYFLLTEPSFASALDDVGKPITHGRDFLTGICKKYIAPGVAVLGMLTSGWFIYHDQAAKRAAVIFGSTVISVGLLINAKAIADLIIGN